MKIVTDIIKAVLVIILTVAITLFGFINIASSTILNKQYAMQKLEETNYYANIYGQVKSDFENYIYQSGLDQIVLDNIVTQEMVKNDVNIIIENIYDGANKTINTNKLKENLNTNIKDSLENKTISSTMQKSIDKFVEKISGQYVETMTHTNFEETINKSYIKIQNYIGIAKKILSGIIIVGIILLLIVNYKKIIKILTNIGIVFSSTGLFYIISNIIINQKVKINTITILNGPISLSLRAILLNILDIIMKYGSIMLLIGVICIASGNFANERGMKKVNKKH